MTFPNTQIALCALFSLAPAVRSADVQDDRYGIAFDVPRSWLTVPERPGEAWQPFVAISDHVYTLSGPRKNETLRPTFRCVVFANPASPQAPDAILRHVYNPHGDYDAWLKTTWGPHAFEITRDERETIHGSSARVVELLTHKKKLPHRRVFQVLYELTGVTVLLEVDLPYEEDAALERELWRCTRSLRDLGTAEPDESARIEPPYPPTDVDGAERRHLFRSAMTDLRERDQERIEESTSRSGTVQKSGSWLLAGDGDSKTASLVLRTAEGVDDWLDDLFGKTTKADARRVLRVFESKVVADAYAFQGTPAYMWAAAELVTTSNDAIHPKLFGNFAVAVAQQRLSNRHDMLWAALPPWFGNGLEWHLEHAQPSRKQGLYLPDLRRALGLVDERARRSSLVPTRDLFKRPRGEVMKEFEINDQEYWAHAVLMTRFLIELPRARRKFLEDYLDQLVLELEDLQGSSWIARLEARRTSGQIYVQAAQDRDLRMERFHARDFATNDPQAYLGVLARTNEQVFASWSDRTWERLHDQFQAFVANGAKM